MVVPSIQENLSNAIMESISCGLPVIAFDIGGNSDMIKHKSNGYLAKPYSSEDLAKGINWIINSNNSDSLSKYSRNLTLHNFSSEIVSKKYIALYKSILNGNS